MLLLDNTQLFLDIVACLVVVVVIARASRPRLKNGLPLPPSPPNWRLMGHFLPTRNSFLTVAKWIDEYGPLITIRTGTETVVIIGRYKAAVDIMEKRGGVLADRPSMSAGQMLTGGLTIAFARAGDRFRRMVEHFIRISSLKQLRRISLCRCRSRRTRSLTFLMTHPTSRTT